MTQQEAVQWIANLFDESAGGLSRESRREDIEAWDSLGVLTLMAGLDADFGIALSDEDFDNLRSVGDILDVLRRHDKVS
jgi:acyl carrier protein